MKEFVIEIFETVTTRRVVVVCADDKTVAEVRATNGGWSHIKEKEGVSVLVEADTKHKHEVAFLADAQLDKLWGYMKDDAILLGTSLKLQAQQAVALVPATNLPPGPRAKFFARPLNGSWSDGVERPTEDSIMVTEDDFEWGIN